MYVPLDDKMYVRACGCMLCVGVHAHTHINIHVNIRKYTHTCIKEWLMSSGEFEAV
jgi:hypothetical protein